MSQQNVSRGKSAIHHRHSIRLSGYDYSQPGEYFITMVTIDRKSIFGKVDGDRVRLNPFGQVARDYWNEIPIHFPNTEIGPFVVMPNHFHGIIHINDDDDNGGRDTACNQGKGKACLAPAITTCHTPTVESFGKPNAGTIPTIIGSYKSAVTKRINEIRGTTATPVWQRNYYEHIIQSDDEYATIAAYIESNPANWTNDEEFVQ